MCVHRGNLLWVFLSLSPPRIPRVSLCGISYWRLTLARPRPDDSCLLRLVWLASFVATGELPSLRDFSSPVQRFLHSPAFPHLPFPVSFSLSLSIYLCLLLSLCPVARRLVRLVCPVYSTCFLTRSKEEKIFPLSFPFSSLSYCCPFVLPFDCPYGATKTVGSS